MIGIQRLAKQEGVLVASLRLFKKGYGLAGVARELRISFKRARQFQRMYMQAEAAAKAVYVEREEVREAFRKFYLQETEKQQEQTIEKLYDAIASENARAVRKAEFFLQHFPDIKQIFIPLPGGGMAEWNDF